jgi:hypothetical protein
VEEVAKVATTSYKDIRAKFRTRYPDLHFVGDVDASERELLSEQRRLSFLDPHDNQFFSVVNAEHIQQFFRLVD